MDEPIIDNQENTIKTPKKRIGRPFEKGNPGGPGRPKGLTIKEQVRKWLEEHPDDNNAFIRHFIKENRDLAWRMLEGNPATDITSKGEAINPVPIYGGQSVKEIQVPRHDSDQESLPTIEENPSS